MTKNNFKVALFGTLLVAMILPFSTMNVAEAKVQNEKTLFEKFLDQAAKQEIIQNQLDNAEHAGDADLVDKLQKKIGKIQKKMDKHQQDYYNEIFMSAEELRALDNEGLKIFNEMSDPTSPAYLGVAPNGYFVSQISKETHLTFDSLPYQPRSSYAGPIGSEPMSAPISALAKVQSNDNKGEYNGTNYTIGFPQKNSHYVNCPDREDDCSYLMGGLAVDESGETSTMTFWAKRTNGDLGFVMTAHGANALDNTINQYPTRNVGTVDVITGETWGDCDCAFVNATETVVKRVFTEENVAKKLTSFSTTDPSIGTWLQISGITSGTITGTYQGIHSTYGMMIDVDTSGGDSGAPVTSIGSSQTVYGMVHADGTYTYATTYADIKSELDLQ